MKRIKYPHRNAWLRNETGLEDNPVVVRVNTQDVQYKETWVIRNSLYGALVVESIDEFKRKHGICF